MDCKVAQYGDDERDHNHRRLPPPVGAGCIGHQESKQIQSDRPVHHLQRPCLPSFFPLVWQPMRQQHDDDNDGSHKGNGVAVEEDKVPGPHVVMHHRVARLVPVVVVLPRPAGGF
uniref:Uncharacterized protein n=1 Tax=Triticum urartu TaxID=4572 RepID=A0A8R7QU67_TRIUA